MGRKLEFNFEEAIEQATGLFWSKGYTKASLRDLLKVMQIGESSFYHSFKDKEGLYLECLRHYNQKVMFPRLETLQSEDSIKSGVRKMFQQVLASNRADPSRPGCFMTNSLERDVMEMPRIKKYVLEEMALLENYLTERIESAMRTGEIDSGIASQDLAELVMTFYQGMLQRPGLPKNDGSRKNLIELFLERMGF